MMVSLSEGEGKVLANDKKLVESKKRETSEKGEICEG
jgi:hypothetical protein